MTHVRNHLRILYCALECDVPVLESYWRMTPAYFVDKLKVKVLEAGYHEYTTQNFITHSVTLWRFYKDRYDQLLGREEPSVAWFAPRLDLVLGNYIKGEFKFQTPRYWPPHKRNLLSEVPENFFIGRRNSYYTKLENGVEQRHNSTACKVYQLVIEALSAINRFIPTINVTEWEESLEH